MSALKRLLVFRSPLMPIGSLIFCLDYALNATEPLGGILTSIRTRFTALAKTPLYDRLQDLYAFRNTYIAHQDKELTDPKQTETALKLWVEVLQGLYEIA
jgi:type III restriction enzyme